MKLNSGDIVTVKEKDPLDNGITYYRVKVIKMLNSYVFNCNIISWGFYPNCSLKEGTGTYAHFTIQEVIS